MADLACLRCGSTNILPDGHVHSQFPVSVEVPTNPAALKLKGTRSKYLRSRICGSCGHVELFVEGAPELWDKYQQNNPERKR